MNAATIIVIIFVILVMGACLLSFLRRLTGKKSCCGTKAPRVKAKKLKDPIGTLTVKIEGMRCESCRRTLTAKLNELDGISAKVSLENKTAVIAFEHSVDDEKIVEVVESAGFEVVEIYG